MSNQETRPPATTGEAAPDKPPLARQVLPPLVAGGILIYMFMKVDFFEVWEKIGEARISWILLAYGGYCFFYYLTDVICFARVYNWLGVDISFGETARLRFASYAVQAVNGAVTELMTVLYLLRVKKVSVVRSASAAGFIYFNETMTVVALMTYCAFFLPEAYRIDALVPHLEIGFWALFQGAIVAAWAIAAFWVIFWSTGIKDLAPGFRDRAILSAFNELSARRHAEIFGWRFLNNFTNLLANVVILRAMHIDAPLELLFAAVPLMVTVAYMPVSAGGFGGPQIVAVYLLRGYADEDAVMAYSLVWSALFFISRSLSGVWFLKPVYKAAFERPARGDSRKSAESAAGAETGGE